LKLGIIYLFELLENLFDFFSKSFPTLTGQFLNIREDCQCPLYLAHGQQMLGGSEKSLRGGRGHMLLALVKQCP